MSFLSRTGTKRALFLFPPGHNLTFIASGSAVVRAVAEEEEEEEGFISSSGPPHIAGKRNDAWPGARRKRG